MGLFKVGDEVSMLGSPIWLTFEVVEIVTTRKLVIRSNATGSAYDADKSRLKHADRFKQLVSEAFAKSKANTGEKNHG